MESSGHGRANAWCMIVFHLYTNFRKEAAIDRLGAPATAISGLRQQQQRKRTDQHNYQGYDKLIAHVTSDTAERQVETGSAFIGTPADIVDMIRAYNDKVGGIDSVSLHFAPSNMQVNAAERSLRLFAREVMPKLATL